MNSLHISTFVESLFEGKKALVGLDRVAGGDINECYCATLSDQTEIFVKVNSDVALLRSEFDSLQQLTSLGMPHYPTIIGFKKTAGVAMLGLRYYQLENLNPQNSAEMANALLVQHAMQSPQFGWSCDNYIGRSVQSNKWCDDWGEFYTQYRLMPQLEFARRNSLSRKLIVQVEKLILNIDAYINLSDIQPSLLHGDLWSGNLAFDVQSQSPVLYDPAPYYGDPEADIAMTRLFGCLPDDFYVAYRRARPEPEDIKQREVVYNLYHALNHFNLFGKIYETLVEDCCQRVLAS